MRGGGELTASKVEMKEYRRRRLIKKLIFNKKKKKEYVYIF